MIFSLLALLIMMIVTGVTYSSTMILLPLVLLYLLIFCIGISLSLSVMLVYFRDTQYLYGVFLTMLNYLTPIFYPVSMLPQWLKDLMPINPMYNYIEMFRKIMLYGEWPHITEHCICFGFAIFSLSIGISVFNKYQKEFILHL